MKQIDFMIPSNEHLEKYKQNKLAKLAKEDHIQKWCQENGVDFNFISKYSGRFDDYVKMKKQCESCLGLKYCNQNQVGYCYSLYIDEDHLQQKIVKCPYLIKKEKMFWHKKYYRRYDFEENDLLLDGTQFDLLKENKDYRTCFKQIMESKDDSKGVYISGNVGVGKSYLAKILANYYARKKMSVAFVNVARLIADFKAVFDEDSGVRKLTNMLKQVDVLVLDDLGGENITSWTRDEILFPLLDHRMNFNKKTIFTSNYRLTPIKDKDSNTLKDIYAITSSSHVDIVACERLMERIRTLSHEVYIKGESRRK